MSRRSIALGALVVLAVLGTACSRAVSVEAEGGNSTPKVVAKKASTKSAKNPHWITQGYAIAARYRASLRKLDRADLTPRSTTETDASPQLPPKAQFVGILTGLGLSAEGANCMYDSIASTPLAGEIASVLTLAVKSANGGQIDPLDPANTAAITGLSGVDEGTIRQLVVAIAPCVDSTTLLTLLAATGLGGSGGLGGAGGLSSLAGLLTTAGATGQLSALANGSVDPNQLASLAGKNLNPQQIAALAGFLGSSALGKLSGLDPKNVDLANLDLTNLNEQQLVLLLAAIAQGLTGDQQSQLTTLANLDLQKAGLQIDTKKLSGEQAGALFLVLLPFISAGVAPPNPQPPIGGDAGQIYIPPGTDLSSINPLYFVPRENVILGLTGQGVNPGVADCLYERLRVIDPRLIGVAFAGSDLRASGQVLLSVVGCVLKL